jgi:hypothetical protein
VSAAFGALGADEVDACGERFGDVLRVADHLRQGVRGPPCDKTEGGRSHVHDQDAGVVQPLYDVSGWHADGADEERRLLFDNHVDQLRELTFRVVVLETRKPFSFELRL